jgi:hypothetical protein
MATPGHVSAMLPRPRSGTQARALANQQANGWPRAQSTHNPEWAHKDEAHTASVAHDSDLDLSSLTTCRDPGLSWTAAPRLWYATACRAAITITCDAGCSASGCARSRCSSASSASTACPFNAAVSTATRPIPPSAMPCPTPCSYRFCTGSGASASTTRACSMSIGARSALRPRRAACSPQAEPGLAQPDRHHLAGIPPNRARRSSMSASSLTRR